MNEVSTTFESKELFVIPTCFIETLFKVHAIREGHQELLKRVARRNGGLVPLAKLQQELQLSAIAVADRVDRHVHIWVAVHEAHQLAANPTRRIVRRIGLTIRLEDDGHIAIASRILKTISEVPTK
jgi:ribosomal protein L39E